MGDPRTCDDGTEFTYFASAHRAGALELDASVRLIAASTVMTQVLQALGGIVAVLNRERQIVATNSGLLAALGVRSLEEVLGLRPGEALGCRHAGTAPAGCGTGNTCADCGAALAILAAQYDGEVAERECLLSVRNENEERSLELKARAAPFVLEGEEFVILSLQDIADRKRRERLERVFLHDLMNFVGALHSYGDLLFNGEAPAADLALEMRGIVRRVVEEVETQRDLTLAEQGDYALKWSVVSTRAVLDELARLMLRHEVACGRLLECGGVDIRIRTDVGMLERVLVNMVKNALEAVPEGGHVAVRCVEDAGSVLFTVHNAGVLSDRVAAHLFQRSYTTKPGVGRGLGTYSMKLFGERYLGGKVGFSSSVDRGTEFRFRLPADATMRSAGRSGML